MDEHNEQTSWLLNVKKIQISIHQSCFKELEPKNIFEISYRNKTNLNRQKTDFPTNSVSLSPKKKISFKLIKFEHRKLTHQSNPVSQKTSNLDGTMKPVNPSKQNH